MTVIPQLWLLWSRLEKQSLSRASNSTSIIALSGLTLAFGISSRARALRFTLNSCFRLNVFQERTVTIRRQTIGGFGLSIKVI